MKTRVTKSGYKVIRLLSGRSNAFLLTNGDKNLLIDTSVSRLWEKLLKQLENLNIKHIDYLILTHAHFDHAGNANKINEKFKSTVLIHKEEAGYLQNGDNILPDGTTFVTRAIVAVLGARFFHKFRYEPCTPDIIVDDAYNLNELGFNAFLLATPGHTCGSMSLIIDNELALVGDAMFGVFSGSVFPPYAQDIDLMIKSWGETVRNQLSGIFTISWLFEQQIFLTKRL